MTDSNSERIFMAVEQAAAHGDRCPQNEQLGQSASTIMGNLARTGRIRIEVYALNFRVVEIMAGPHKGKRTAEPPGYPQVRLKPYRVIEAEPGYCGPKSVRQAPSAPRPLSADELAKL